MAKNIKLMPEIIDMFVNSILVGGIRWKHAFKTSFFFLYYISQTPYKTFFVQLFIFII